MGRTKIYYSTISTSMYCKLKNDHLQGIFSRRGAATSLRIQETIKERAKRPQYAILADLRLILETTVRHASHAHAAQHDARQEAAHIFFSSHSHQFKSLPANEPDPTQ